MTRQLTMALPDTTRPSGAMCERLARINAADPVRRTRWVPSRLIVQNFWYVDYQEFHFAGGRLVLNGPNGSGKSSIGAAAVPIALDLRRDRRRFDPFGGQERGPAYYLLGLPNATAQASFYHEDRTGYVVWEFEHGTEVVTIGVGLRARRADGDDPPLRAWGFVAPGKRVGVDFELTTTDARGRRLPLTQADLVRTLGAGSVFGKNREYQEAVNRALFQFDSVEEFLTYTDTLLTLRAPKLDRGVSPETLSNSLQGALPALSGDLVDRLSSLIRHIDSATDALQRTADHVRRVATVHEAQGDYANQVAQQAAVAYLTAAGALADVRAAYETSAATLRSRKIEYEEVSARFDAAAQALGAKRAALDVKRASDAYANLEQLDVAAQELRKAAAAVSRAERDLEHATTALAGAEAQQNTTELLYESDVEEIRAAARTLAEPIRAARWPLAETHLRQGLAALDKATVRAYPSYEEDPRTRLDLVVLRAQGDQRQQACRHVETALGARDAARRAHDEARHKLELAQTQVQHADGLVRERAAALDADRGGALAAVEAWAAHAPFLVPEPALAETREGLERYEAPEPPTRVTVALQAAGRKAAAVHRAALEAAAEGRLVAQQRRKALRGDLAHWEAQRWAVPTPRPGQGVARERLEAAGVTAVPLYAACDFMPDVPPAVQGAVEAALEDAGLLDALVVPPASAPTVAGVLGSDGTAGDRWLSAAASHQPTLTAGTLAEVLQPATDRLDDWDVRAVLAAIRWGGDRDGARAGASAPVALVEANGAWRQGILTGRAARRSEAGAQYIGEANRERRRAATMAELRRQLSDVEAELAMFEDAVEAARGAHRDIDAGLTSLADLPALQNLQAAAFALEAANRELRRALAHAQSVEQDVAVKQAAARGADAAVEGALADVPEARGLGAGQVRELRSATGRLVTDVQALGDAIKRLDRLRDAFAAGVDSVRAARDAVEERTAQVGERAVERSSVAARIDAIQQLLGGRDADALRREVATLREEIERLDVEHTRLSGQRGTAGEAVRQLSGQTDRQGDAIVQAEGEETRARREFERQLQGYRQPDLERALLKYHNADEGPEAAARDLLRNRRAEADALGERVEQRLARIVGVLARAFQEHRMDLAEYRPELLDNQASFVSPGDGQRVAPDVLLQRLREVEHEQRQGVSEAENELYVNFFLGDVIGAVRRNVLRAEDFTTRVNAVLGDMRFSNGAALSFTWEPRTEHGKGGVDYTKLVKYVKLDPEAVTEEKRQAMLAEFRARVDAVRSTPDGGREGAYGARLAQEFDYRTWYTFRFFFKKPDGVQVELKQRGIEQLSGGERTLAQVLPLLAAAHARSLAARNPAAPKVIAMDEAFAGVDHQNTNEVLRAMVALEFSWILMSDKLWGDSRDVPSCATYHLKAEGGVLLPMLFVWDGHRRTSEEDLAEAADRAAFGVPDGSTAPATTSPTLVGA